VCPWGVTQGDFSIEGLKIYRFLSMVIWQRVWKSLTRSIDAVRSPPSIEIHRSLALLASKSIKERAFVKPNEPTFRVLQRSAYRLLSTTSDLSPHLVVQTSSIAGSGNGVFASRSFEMGDVLTLYPGCIYSHLSVPSLESSVFESVRETTPQPGTLVIVLHDKFTRIGLDPTAATCIVISFVPFH
jgi:hypothetical protein